MSQPPPYPPLVAEALQAMQAGRFDQAEQLAARALADAPQSYEARQVRALFVGEGAHLVIEAGQGDMAVLIVHAGDELGQRLGRVVDRTAKDARVQIVIRAVNPQFEIGQAAQAIGQGG